MDADSQPLLDPTALFDWHDYKQKGNLFFPGGSLSLSYTMGLCFLERVLNMRAVSE